ncbi:hypothetical protein HPB48_010596 [Haemaphysalis longicornis]|uniref:Uncharacterized protein n=1 Tax=Haemaphysalis longicornis TaxID=44386 RepID=A0A9J6H300_HAELO|nr:hypothetical protein HPB48_010596 [Haemaphysalis longicornis]
MEHLEDADSDDMDTTGTNGSYFFSSWGYGDRLILRDLYRRYAFPKVHFMKKIELSGRGQSCGHWPMWRAMAKALLSEVRKKISPKDLENFFWDVLAEGSEVAATLDRMLDCRHAVRSPRTRSARAVVPKVKVKPDRRTSATIHSEGIDEGGGQQKTAVLDLTPRQPLRDKVKVEPFSLDEQGVVASFEPTTVEGGGGRGHRFRHAAGVCSRLGQRRRLPCWT